MRWLLGVTAAAALLLATAATGTAAAVKRYDRHGVSFTYPAAWVVTTRPLSNVTNPRYRVTVSTAPVERTSRDDGPCLPGIAGQLPKDAVLMYVMEALGTDRIVSLPRMQPRPRSFRLPARSDNSLCGFNRGGLWVPFKDRWTRLLSRHLRWPTCVGRHAACAPPTLGRHANPASLAGSASRTLSILAATAHTPRCPSPRDGRRAETRRARPLESGT